MTNLNIEDLKCCGNCEYAPLNENSFCRNKYNRSFSTYSHENCDSWQFDKITQEERLIK